jgi:hypothetical protein
MTSPIEQYLDELVVAVGTRRPRELRDLLAEAESHLRDAADANEAAGMSRFDAEADAVARFGSAYEIAAAEHRRTDVPLRRLAVQVVVTAWLLGAIGAIAVGLSGAIAALYRAIGGDRAVIDAPGVGAMTRANCSRWLQAVPGAHDCRAAGLADWANETVYYRLALGVVGVVALVAFAAVRRHVVLPPIVADTIATTLFTAAGLFTLTMGIDAAIATGSGWGQWLSAAPVAVVAAAVFGVRVLRDLRDLPRAVHAG